MPSSANNDWNAQAAFAAWDQYAEGLLRSIAAKTIKTRQKLTASELRQRLSHWTENTPQVDRRLKEITPSAHTLLEVLRLGKHYQWRVSTLLELASCLRVTPILPSSLEGKSIKGGDGLKVVEELFLHGMLLADLPADQTKISNFEDWLGKGLSGQFRAWISPQILSRVGSSWEALAGFEEAAPEMVGMPQEADGLEWFLRLAALWQQIHDLPARLTQQGGFFKRDQDRLTNDALLNQPATDFLVTLPQIGHFLVSLGLSLGMFEIEEMQLTFRQIPESWQHGWTAALSAMLGAGSELTTWSVDKGWSGLPGVTSPFSSALLLLMSVLTRGEREKWFTISGLAQWLVRNHTFWSPLEHPPDLLPAIEALLLGWLYPLRILQATRTAEGSWSVRLSPFGRSLLTGQEGGNFPEMPKMLLVQPNHEILAYRQGLTPRLIATLSQMATWTALGSACTLHLDQSSIHRGLEAGATFESITDLLERHGVHSTPSNVLEAIRTWAAKRDRVTVYQRANLLEFLNKADRDSALGRGLQGIPLAERFLLIEDEHALDFRNFRTLGTRDYALPPMVCVVVAPDGVTLTIDTSKADLLLESELQRFSVPRRADDCGVYLVSPESLAMARTQGISLRFLEDWFRQRTGQPMSAAVRLLWSERNGEQAQLRQQVILTLPSETIADGLWQWPETRELLQERLGSLSFIVSANRLKPLLLKLQEIAYPFRSELDLESKLEESSRQ